MENQTNSNEDIQEMSENSNNVAINQEKLEAYFNEMRQHQNFNRALVGGFAAMLLSAILWAAITVATEYQIGYMAVAVGLLVGFAVRYNGKGIDKKFGIAGALFAIAGCLLGNLFSIIGFVASAEGLGYFETLSLINFSVIPQIMVDTFNPVDLLFYGIAIYEGYKFSFRKFTEEEIMANAGEPVIAGTEAAS